jgi:hypothetical protein
MRRIALLVLITSGCSTVTIARVDHCTVQRTQEPTFTREQILFCDDDPPAWSSDRAVRLAQECLHQSAQVRREAIVTAARVGQAPPPADDDAFKQCLPEALQAVQAENEQLKDSVTRADAARVRVEGEESKLQDALAKALNRPINAVADARSTSDSGADVKHQSELSHVDNTHVNPAPTTPKAPIIRRGSFTTQPVKTVACALPTPAPTAAVPATCPCAETSDKAAAP